MSILYTPKDKQVLKIDIVKDFEGNIVMYFEKDIGKHGVDETIDAYKLTPERLLNILQDRDDYTDEELDL